MKAVSAATTALALTHALALAACSRAPEPQSPTDSPADAVRMAMPDEEDASAAVAGGAAAPAWSASLDGRTASFGALGGPPLLSVTCREGVLIITRHAAAPVGAQALFALVGSEGIMRLPVDATSVPGHRGYLWQGMIAADDPRTKVLGGAYTGTLPGAGMIKVPTGNPVREVLARCRAAGHSLPPQPAGSDSAAE